MNINGISGAGAQAAPAGTGAGQAMDAQSKNIRKQIEEAQKKLQEISSNGEISPEEKMKKRQEIQKQISDLRMQLRQHEIELKRQQQAEKKAAENGTGREEKSEQHTTGLSAAGMQAVISADTSMKQAKVQNSVAVKMEGRAGVLETEIKQDGRTGGNTQAKEAELAETKQKADEAKASGLETLKEADRKMKEAAGAEQDIATERIDTTNEKEKEKTEENKTEQTDKSSEETDDKAGKEPGMYVDVRL